MSNQPLTTGDEPSLSGGHPTDRQLEPGLGGEAALTHLIETIHHEDLSVRCRAVEQLEAIGSERAIELLEQVIADPNASVRIRAIKALGKMQSGRVVDILRDKLQAETDLQVRSQVIRSLGETGSERAVDPLIRYLQSGESPWERSHAADSLGQIDSPKAVEALGQALYDQYGVRQSASQALRQIGENHPDAIQPVVDQLLEDLFGPPGSNERFHAVVALSIIHPASAVPRLLAVMQDPEQPLDQRIAATSGLKSIRDRRTAAPLLELFTTTQDGSLRYYAAQALTVIRDREVIPMLIDLLKHETWQVRRFTARILGRRDVRSAVPHLVELLGESKAPVRKEAADALRRLRRAENISQAVEPLIHALGDRSRDVRKAAAHALGHIHEPGVVEALATFFQDSSDDRERRVALGALLRIHYRHPEAITEVVEVIESALADENPTISWYAHLILENRD